MYIPGDCPRVFRAKHAYIPRDCPRVFKGAFVYNLANKFDDPGRCANLATKVINGGFFIEGTLVTVSRLPGQSTSTDSLWSDPSWLDEPSQETPWFAPEHYASVATRSQLQVPIESVPIGSRVPTKNPNRLEVDPQPEPDQATWAKVSITVERSDGGIVDAEIIRPRSWILASGLCAGRMLLLNLPELEVSGLALVTAIDAAHQSHPAKAQSSPPGLLRAKSTWWPEWMCWVPMALSKPSPGRPSTLCGQSIARNGCRWLS